MLVEFLLPSSRAVPCLLACCVGQSGRFDLRIVSWFIVSHLMIMFIATFGGAGHSYLFTLYLGFVHSPSWHDSRLGIPRGEHYRQFSKLASDVFVGDREIHGQAFLGLPRKPL